MAAVATGREVDAKVEAKTKAGSGSDEGTTTQAPGDPTGGNAGGNTASGGSQQANSARDPGCASWDQPPPTNAQLLTPGLANAFGIQMMRGYRIPAPAPGHAGNATDSGNGVHSGKHASKNQAEAGMDSAAGNRRAPIRTTNANPPPAFDGAQQHLQHRQHQQMGTTAAQMQQMGAASAMAAMAQQYAFASSPNGMAAQMQMHQQMHQYAVAQHFAQQAQAQQQHHARGSGVVNGPPHGHGAFYGSPGGGAGVAAASATATTMVSAALAWELVVTALLCASVATCILLDAASIYKVLQKIRLYVYGALLMVFGRDKRWTRRPLDTATLAALGPTKTKRIIFIRHGESEWNLIFNKGPKPLLPFKAILGLVREIKMFFALDMGSVLYDSPLNQEGLEQAQELASLLRGDADWGDVPDPAQRDADAATLRGGADAPLSSVVASSNLRRALHGLPSGGHCLVRRACEVASFGGCNASSTLMRLRLGLLCEMVRLSAL